MSPEQALAGRGATIGPPADIWGIGATLFHAAAGERPFEKGDHDSKEREKRWPQIVAPPKPLPDSIQAAVAHPLMACLAYEPADRPSPIELADALEPVLAGLPKPWVSKLKPRRGR
jgi:serine/threonine protein kinase